MGIRLEQLTKRYDGRPVVSNLSLDVKRGELCVLLGPSGSGKSTILRLIAGLAPIDAGRILLSGRDISGVPARDRDLGFVFQSYALFRRMTVAENVEFALSVRRVARAERRRRREELLELVGLSGLGGRLPHQLSGGQQQRVALARALAHRPSLLLLDEPFGALDARIRVDLRRSLAAVQRRLEITTLFVTHDQEEAFELGDRIAVMAQGRLIEEGPPRELYLRPATEFVATFLGGANLLVGESSPAGVRIGPIDMAVGGGVRAEGGGRRVQVLFRPEDVALAPTREALSPPALGEAVVEQISFVGAVERLRLHLPALPRVRVIQPAPPFGGAVIPVDAARSQHEARRLPLAPGDRVWVGVRRIHALRHPGLALVVAPEPGGATAARDYAVELARLAQARLSHAAPAAGGGQSATARVVAAVDAALAAEPANLVVAALPERNGSELAEMLLATADCHLLLVRGARPLPPQRFLLAVAVGEPGKQDVVFAGRLARHLGSPATVLTVLAPEDDQEVTAAAERFLSACARTLEALVPATSTEVGRGELSEVLRRRMRDGHDLLVLGAPLADAEGRLRFAKTARRLLDEPGDYPILIVRAVPGTASWEPR